jgi:hypothetical protein
LNLVRQFSFIILFGYQAFQTQVVYDILKKSVIFVKSLLIPGNRDNRTRQILKINSLSVKEHPEIQGIKIKVKWFIVV